MNFNAFLSKDADPVQPMDKVLENHFVNIEKGQFDPATFCSDLKAIPSEHIDYRKCAQSLMKLTKERVTGTSNYKIVHNLEKMMDILLENFTVKKSGVCEVLFFPNPENEAKIIEYLKSAKKSINVCMFAITNETLCTALLEAHLRGVQVRLITDEEEVKLTGSTVKDLGDEGIQIRTDNSGESLMHNKFVIIDQKILMTGSYNWTVASTEVNQENVVIMENDHLVETFMNEFNKLWKQFSPQDLDDQKARNKTRLFFKYQEAQKKKDKKPLALMSQEDPEDIILDAGGINPIGKKIGKIQMFKDLLCCKRMRKVKQTYDSDDELEEDVEAPIKKSEISRYFIKAGLFMFYMFSLIVFSRGLGGAICQASTIMELENME